MINPTNPKDNLVDSWNNDESISELFFDWLDVIDKEVAKIISNPTNTVLYENLLGVKAIGEALGMTQKENTTKGPKPYGEY